MHDNEPVTYDQFLYTLEQYECKVDDTFFPGWARQFLIVTPEGYVFIKNEWEVSSLFDMSDVEDTDGTRVFTWIDGEFHEVKPRGSMNRINTDEEMPFNYGMTRLVTDHGKTVGHVTYTGH